MWSVIGDVLWFGILKLFSDFWRDSRGAETDLLREQADKRNGVIQKRFLRSPKLIINHRACDVTIHSPSKHQALAVARGRGMPFQRLVIRHPDSGQEDGETPPGQLLATGNPDFDRAYAIYGDDEAFARGFLTAKVQQQLLSLKRRWNSSVEITPGQLCLRIQSPLSNTGEYDAFIDVCLFLVDRWRGLYQ